MEVHHHSHTPDSYRDKRKKWTHYLWEFVMLFLAVFCGFLAEYQLEHVIDHQREKKYILSLLEDLKTDTSTILSYLRTQQTRVSRMDSLIHLLVTGDYKKMGSKTYFIARQVSAGRIIFADGTMQQLKNAGGLRLIKKQVVIDSIMAYDIAVRRQTYQEDIAVGMVVRFREIAEDVFHAGIFYEIVDSSGRSVFPPTGNPPLITNDPLIINKMAVRASYVAHIQKTNIVLAYSLKSKAALLIEFLKKEYKIK